jgi:hypothetical protein
MPQKGKKRRRGRPSNPEAKRHQTTRAGRRGEDARDRGTTLLRRHKRQVLAGREDLPMDGAAVLYAHQHLDGLQYDVLGQISRWLQVWALALGCRDGSPAHRWRALLAAATTEGGGPWSGPTPPGAEVARRQLARLGRALNGSHQLVLQLAENQLPQIVERVIAGRLTPFDRVALEALRKGLDQFAGRR